MADRNAAAGREGAKDGGADALTIRAAAFAAEVARLAGPDFRADEKIALAVSGGSDSLALLILAARAFPARAIVLSVDHGLRPEAAAECRMVERVARQHGLAAETLRLALPKGASVQGIARRERYRAMAGRAKAHRIRFLLTAHHRDDQAETLLLRLARGSGLAGLAAIRARTTIDGIMVLRPLLAHGRAELRQITAAAGLAPACDPSNDDPHYDRTQARRLLRDTPWLDPRRLADVAAHLAEAEEALLWATTRAFAGRVAEDGGGRLVVDAEALPPELGRRLLVAALAARATEADGPAIARLLATLARGRKGMIGAVTVTPKEGRWIIAAAPPRRAPRRT